jgi:hypothetical protein
MATAADFWEQTLSGSLSSFPVFAAGLWLSHRSLKKHLTKVTNQQTSKLEATTNEQTRTIRKFTDEQTAQLRRGLPRWLRPRGGKNSYDDRRGS